MKKVSNGFIYTFGALGGLLFGYDIASVSGAILFIQKQLHLNSWQQGWVVSSVLIGATLGALGTSKFLDKYGRRKLLIWASIIFAIGALGSGFAPEYWTLLVTRIILGIGVGVTSALIPAYLHELAPKKIHGAVATMFQLMVMIGILLAYILNYTLVRPALITGLGAAIFQQIIGSNSVVFYAPTIFTKVGWGVAAALLAHIGIGTINVIVTVVAMLMMDHVDRKKMLCVGATGMGLSLFIMAGILHFNAGGKAAAYVSAICLTVYVAFYACTWAPITWVLIGEVFPLNIRGLGTSLASATNWIADMLVSLTFPSMLSAMGLSNTFITYGIICFICVWFTHKYFIETRGKSLEEIEAGLREHLAKSEAKKAH